MRGTRSRGGVLRLVTFAGASVVAAGALAGTGGAVLAGPLPKPPGQAQAVRSEHAAGKGRAQARHGGHAAGRRHARPRTVVRCQNDDTDQTDEFDTDSDSDTPSHFVSPDSTAPAGRCSRDALALAGLLSGDHRTHAARR
jgi:hypothetical protein